jgi:hypothetical protein
MIERIPRGAVVEGVDWRHRKILDYYRIVEQRAAGFECRDCDRASIAAGRCFVLGTPRTLIRLQRAGVATEPFLGLEGTLTVYRAKAGEAQPGQAAPQESRPGGTGQRFKVGGRRSANP